jgi:hypothetical protein
MNFRAYSAQVGHRFRIIPASVPGIAAGFGAKRRWSFSELSFSLRFKSPGLFFGFPNRLSLKFNLVTVMQ